jgi:hypothetical protein
VFRAEEDQEDRQPLYVLTVERTSKATKFRYSSLGAQTYPSNSSAAL